MGLFIPPHMSRGHIIKGFIPYRGEAPLWARNLLILGFVFRGDKDYPHALMTARLTVKPTENHDTDFMFPRHEMGWNGIKSVTLRTNRVDIIPRREDIFGERMEPAGFIRDAEIMEDIISALEHGMESEDAQDSIYLKLRSDDCVRTSFSPNSPLVMLPETVRKRLAMTDYDYALEERDRQVQRHRLELVLEYQPVAKPAPVAEEPKEIPLPIAEIEPKAASIPWWKENPELLQEKIAEAALTPSRKKFKPILSDLYPEFHEVADLSSMTELFGVSVKAKEESACKASVQNKADKTKPVLSRASMQQRLSQVRYWSDIFFEVFNEMAKGDVNPQAPLILQEYDFKRGQAIRIKPLIQSGNPQSNVGLLWNIYHDPQRGSIEALDLIVCRRSTEEIEDAVEICDPHSLGERNGFIASPHEIFRVPLTADFVHLWQSQAKPINPVFLEQIAAKIGPGNPSTIHGVEAIAAHWEKEEPEIAWVTGEDVLAYQQFQMKPKTQPKDWSKRRAPEIN